MAPSAPSTPEDFSYFHLLRV
jgi:hypothetical protein